MNNELTEITTNPFTNQNQFNSLPLSFQFNHHKKNQHLNKENISQYSPDAKLSITSISEKLQIIADNAKQQAEKNQSANFAFKQLKSYTETLEKRNIELLIQLQKQKNKNHQFLTTLQLMKKEDEIHYKNIDQKNIKFNQIQQQLNSYKLKSEKMISELNILKAENQYLKELVFIANQNYQALETKNKQIQQKIQCNELERTKRQAQFIEGTMHMKDIFLKLMEQKNVQQEKKKQQPQSHPKTTKKDIEETYRKMFVKTLKTKK